MTIARLFKLGRNGAQARVLLEFVDVRKNTFHKLSSGGWIFDSDVVSDGLEIG